MAVAPAINRHRSNVAVAISRDRRGVGFDIACSASQINQTMAAPRPTTIPSNSNVNSGMVSIFSIPKAMQSVYPPTGSKTRPCHDKQRGGAVIR